MTIHEGGAPCYGKAGAPPSTYHVRCKNIICPICLCYFTDKQNYTNLTSPHNWVWFKTGYGSGSWFSLIVIILALT